MRSLPDGFPGGTPRSRLWLLRNSAEPHADSTQSPCSHARDATVPQLGEAHCVPLNERTQSGTCSDSQGLWLHIRSKRNTTAGTQECAGTGSPGTPVRLELTRCGGLFQVLDPPARQCGGGPFLGDLEARLGVLVMLFDEQPLTRTPLHPNKGK